MPRLARLVHRRRLLIVLGAVVLFFAAAVVGGPVAGQLEVTTTDFQDPQSENLAARDEIEDASGQLADLNVVVLVPTRTDVRIDPAARRYVRSVRKGVAAIPGVERVVGLSRATFGQVTARDGHLTMLRAAVPDDASTRQITASVRKRYGAAGVRVGGSEAVASEIGHKVSSDLARAELMAFPILFLLSLWVFRGVVAALLPPLIGGLTIVTTFVVLRVVDSAVTSVSLFALNLVTGIGLGLAIDYSLFVVSRFREELAGGADTAQALARTMATAGRTVLFSALTIAAAMAALLVFPLRFLYSMGIGGVAAALVGAGVALVVLPAILAMLGPRVDALAPARWRRAGETSARPATSGGWYRLAHAVMRRPATIALATAAVLVVTGLAFLRAQFVPADHKMLPASSPARQVAETVEREFPAAAADPIEIVAIAPPGQRDDVRAYHREIAALARGAVVTPVRRLDYSTWRIDVLPRGDPLSQANLDLVRAVRRAPAAFPVKVGGAAAAFADQQKALAAHLPVAVTLLALTTFAILFLMTGSVVLPIKALLMNVLSVSTAFGILVLVFQDGRLEGLLDFSSAGGLEATQPVLLFAIAFGLATDYGVFLLSRIKEARDSGMSDREAVAFGVERTGRIVTAAALLFCVAIGAFATSGILFIKQVGVGTALAVAIDATIIRALLVPALMTLLGRWNWWAPPPLRRLHARFGVSEAAA